MKRCVTTTAVALLLAIAANMAGAAIITDDGVGWSAISLNAPFPTASSVADGDPVTISGNVTDLNYDDAIIEQGDLAADLIASETYLIRFQFYNDFGNAATAPNQLSAYLLTDDNDNDSIDAGDSYWLLDLADPSPGWNYYNAFINSSGWYSPNNPGGDFQTSIATGGALNAAGIRIWYDSSGQQDYGLSDYTLYDINAVPEPGTYMMLSTALMSLGFTYARRRRAKKDKC